MSSTNNRHHEWKIDKSINRNSSPKKNPEHRLKKICSQNCRWNQWSIHEIRSNYYHCLSNSNCEEFLCWLCCSNSIIFNSHFIISRWSSSLRKIFNFVFFSLFSAIFIFFHFKWSFVCLKKFFHEFSFSVTSNFDKNVAFTKTITNSDISDSNFLNSKIQDSTTSNFAISSSVEEIPRKYSTNNFVRQCSDFWIFQFRL